MKVTGNVKYIPAGTTQYIVDGSDGEINVDTSVSAVTIILPNIINSGYENTDKGFIINDISGNASIYNITITASDNTVNSQSSVLISANGGTAQCSIASMNEWFIVIEPATSGMSGNLTPNYIPKAVTSSTLNDSVIYQSGSRIGIGTINPVSNLTISATNSDSCFITSQRYGASTDPAGFSAMKARGAESSPSQVLSGDSMLTVSAFGYKSSGAFSLAVGGMIFYAKENFTGSANGTAFKLSTTPLGSTTGVFNFGINEDGNVTIGDSSLSSPARLYVKAIDSTSSNYAIKVDNSASSPLFYLRDDGNLQISTTGSGTAAIEINTQSAQDSKIYFSTNGSATIRGRIYLEDSTQTFNFYTLNNSTIFWNGNGIAQVKTFTLFTDTTAKFESSLGVGVTAATDTIFHAQGVSSTSSAYALKVDNLATTPLLYVRNDGLVSMPSLPTSDVGLATGDLYVDTAANILANGDKVVGWKV